MKAALIVGLLVGLVGIVGAAGYYPWVDHPRLPSKTRVMPNGGRLESFIIRLPADLISVRGGLGAGVRGTPFPPDSPTQDPFEGQLLSEHFKLRDTVGDVIGIASRHVVDSEQGMVSTWSLTFPSRGSLWLSGRGAPDMVQQALEEAGYQPGEDYSGDIRLDLSTGADGERSGVIVDGNGEFRSLGGEYQESWHISGVAEQGSLRGTIRLDTVIRSRP